MVRNNRIIQRKVVKTVISYILIICLLFSNTIWIYAKSEDLESDFGNNFYDCCAQGIDQDEVTRELCEKKDCGVDEIVSLREEYSKHFQLDDGTYVAINYGNPVHRRDESGRWVDIDNRLSVASENMLSTKDGRFSFAASSRSKELCIISDGDYRIAFGFVDTENNAKAEVINHSDRENKIKGAPTEEKYEVLKTIDNSTSVTYKGISHYIDLTYTVSANDVKEQLVLEKPSDTNVFVFSLNTEYLTPVLSGDGSIDLINKEGMSVYRIPAPYMFDSEGETSDCVRYTLEKETDGYRLSIVADKEWLNAAERVYPVVIDPSVTPTNLYDTYINMYSPGVNYGSATELILETNKYVYMRANLPTLPTYAQINYVSLNMKCARYANPGSVDIGVYRVLRSWTESGLTWSIANAWTNKGLSTTRSALATATVTSSNTSTNPVAVSCNITDLVKEWYAGGSNYGIGLKYEDGSTSALSILSYESNPAYRSYYEITYSIITPTVENGIYFIKNKKTGRYVDIKDKNMADGTIIHQWNFHSDATQRWIVTYSHSGMYYTLESVNPPDGYYLRVKNDSSGNDIDIVLHSGKDTNQTVTISDGMLWEILTSSSGAKIFKAATGQTNNRVLAIEVWENNGAHVQQRDYVNDSNYKDEWLLSTPKDPSYSILLGYKVPTRSFCIQCVGTDATGTTWYPLITASASAWNATAAGTNITLSNSSSPYTCEVSSYLGVIWRGRMVPHENNGVLSTAEIEINTILCTGTTNEKKSTITHEIGHLLGLKDDPPLTPNDSLMHHDRNRAVIYTPTDYDIMNVIYFYNYN